MPRPTSLIDFACTYSDLLIGTQILWEGFTQGKFANALEDILK
jgi:hypothetical protein